MFFANRNRARASAAVAGILLKLLGKSQQAATHQPVGRGSCQSATAFGLLLANFRIFVICTFAHFTVVNTREARTFALRRDSRASTPNHSFPLVPRANVTVENKFSIFLFRI